MSFDKRFHRLFPSDLATATAYYDNIFVNLGDRLRDSVRDNFRTIVDRPESFGLISTIDVKLVIPLPTDPVEIPVP